MPAPIQVAIPVGQYLVKVASLCGAIKADTPGHSFNATNSSKREVSTHKPATVNICIADSADQKSALLVSMPAERNKKLVAKAEINAPGNTNHHLCTSDEGADDIPISPDVVGRALSPRVRFSSISFWCLISKFVSTAAAARKTRPVNGAFNCSAMSHP